MRTSTEEDTSKVLTASLKWAERRLPVGFDGDGGGGGDGGASEGDQADAGASDAGASGDGGSGGTQGASDGGAAAFEARIARLEESNRKLQSERDRALAERSKDTGSTGDGSGSVDPEALVSQLEERFAKRESLRIAADKLGKKYGRADKGILKRALDFDSPEALEAAVKESHDAISSVIETELEAERSKLLKDIEERYGVRVAPAGDAGKGNEAPKITIEQIEAMSLDEMADFELQNPGLIKSVLSLRSATT